jgi:trafficking protein particle complex subunit 2
MHLNAVAFISPQNHPILIRTFVKPQDELKYHYIAHTSLDVIEERGAGPLRESVAVTVN